MSNTLDKLVIKCASCGNSCSVIKVQEEYYPGEFIDLYTSSCCNAQVMDEDSRDYRQVTLKQYFRYQVRHTQLRPVLQ